MTMPGASNFLELRHASTDHAIFVVVPERTFFAIDGVGHPEGADFRLATSTLRAAIDLLVRQLRRANIRTATRTGVVECGWMPPQPLPPTELPAAFRDRSRWYWRQMIELPGQTPETHALAAIDETRRGAGRDRAIIRRITFTEGRAAQLLHVGPRTAEPDTVYRLLEAIDGSGLRPIGRLHTLVLAAADVAPNGMGRSILRQPVI